MRTRKFISIILAFVMFVGVFSAFSFEAKAAIRLSFVGDEITYRISGQLGTDEVQNNIKNITIDEENSTATGEILSITEETGKVKVTFKGTTYGSLEIKYQKYDGTAWQSCDREYEIFPCITLGSSMTVVLKGFNYSEEAVDKNLKNFSSTTAHGLRYPNRGK